VPARLRLKIVNPSFEGQPAYTNMQIFSAVSNYDEAKQHSAITK
jgi:hypothetical protein